MSRITHYLKEVRIELKKVNWPTRSQTTKYTIAVIGMSFAMAIFFGGLDYVFSLVLNNFVF
jgi:preprotein translocase subunit SecE